MVTEYWWPSQIIIMLILRITETLESGPTRCRRRGLLAKGGEQVNASNQLQRISPVSYSHLHGSVEIIKQVFLAAARCGVGVWAAQISQPSWVSTPWSSMVVIVLPLACMDNKTRCGRIRRWSATSPPRCPCPVVWRRPAAAVANRFYYYF